LSLTLRHLRARAVNVPMARPLVTGSGSVNTAPLVLIDLETEEGITGSSYVFCYTPIALEPVAQLVSNLADVLRGESAAPYEIERRLQQRFRLIGPQGLIGMAMAGVDMAAWDAHAKALGVPLVRLLGGEPQPIQAYNSCGLSIMGAGPAAAEAKELVAPGFRAIKVRLGYPDVETDLAVVRSIRNAVGKDIALMVDYNQCLSVPEAIARARRLDEERLYWIEEPTRADDYAGHAAIRRESQAPIQIGENWWGPHDMSKSLAAGASNFVMPDAVKIGGVTGWLRAAALAEAEGTPMSCHLFPEISRHLLAVTPTSHWLEFVDWANPILREPVKFEDGHATAPDAPGIGIEWNEEAVARFLWSPP
jgi:mandelate racemase